MRKAWFTLLILLSVGSLIPTAGCGKPDDGLSDTQHQQTDRLDDIAKKADGDWSKVPPADQDYVKKTFTSGDENAAKMLLLGKAGKIGQKGVQAGPPHP